MTTKVCGQMAALRYTWAGREEAFICLMCAPRLAAVARAMGYPLQMLPLHPLEGVFRYCSQNVKVQDEDDSSSPQPQTALEDDEPPLMPTTYTAPESEPEPAYSGGGGTFDGGGSSGSWDSGSSSSSSDSCSSSDSGSSSSDSGSSCSTD